MTSPSVRKYALLVSILASFLTPFMSSSINLALPSLSMEFRISAVLTNWIPTIFLLTSAMFVLPFGRLADIYGRKRVFLIGVILYTISSLLCAFSFDLYSLLSFRSLQGVGGAMIFSTGIAILTSAYPPGERGRVLGLNAAAVYLGLSLGPVLGGFFTNQWSWRSIFFFNVLVGVIVIGVTIFRLRDEWVGTSGERLDWKGTFFYCLAIALLMFGLSSAKELIFLLPLLIGIVAMVVFILMERRARYPLIELRLFRRNPIFAYSNWAALINYSATFSAGVLLSFYLQATREMSPQIAGLVLLSQPLFQSFVSPFAGRLSDRLEPRIVASTGMALATVTLVVFAFLSPETPLWLVIANLILLGVGLAFFSAPNTNAVMGSVPLSHYGVASSILSTMRLAGQTMSMALITLFFSIFLGSEKISYASSANFLLSSRVAFLIFAFLSLLGTFASLARGNVRGKIGKSISES